MGAPKDRDLLEGTWWFPLRHYLPGWGLPVCWQGWAVLGVFFLLVCVGTPLFVRAHHPGFLAAYLGCLTLVLLCVVFAKGERIR